MEIDHQKEQKQLVNLYRSLLRRAKPFLKEGDAAQIRKAFKFAVEAHKDMRRKSGEPFVYHPIAVATIVVKEIGLGPTSIISALLHDVVEDTEYTFKDIEDRFGVKVARIIDGLTKISGTISKSQSMQAENFRKMLLTISEDVRVVLIKIADRLHNMRTLDSMPKDKQLKIKSETEYIYAPLAHRLGLYSIKSELEDLSLKYADRSVYDSIQGKINDTEVERNRFIRNFLRPIDKELKKLNSPFKIKARTKSIRSIYNKMKKQNVPFEEVYDLFAIRIIFDAPREEEKSTCWKIYSIVTDFYTPNVKRLRDWISVPKANGYESLHTTVMSHKGQWVEVQIRSQRMDDIAEMGYAAHWKYKDGSNKGEHGIEAWLSRIREILENNDLNAIEFIDEFRSNLFNKEVFVFTPKGDLKVFANGATILDFAFEIHSEVGARCLGAKINGRLVPLNHQLQNGDQVEILTSNKPTANEGWLKIIKTSKARNKIKEYLKEDKKRVATLGKETVIRKLKHLKMPFNDAAIHKMMDYFSIKPEIDLFYQIGAGTLDHTLIKRAFEPNNNGAANGKKIRPSNASEFKKQFKEVKKDTSADELVIGEDMDSVDYSLAQCCNPIQGDDIFGFITINKGIKIHRANCPNSVSMMANYGYRIVKARWASDKSSYYEASLSIQGTDRVGLVTEITKVISDEMHINITNIHIGTVDGIFKGHIELSVKDTGEVESLIRKIEAIFGVVKVIRNESEPQYGES